MTRKEWKEFISYLVDRLEKAGSTKTKTEQNAYLQEFYQKVTSSGVTWYELFGLDEPRTSSNGKRGEYEPQQTAERTTKEDQEWIDKAIDIVWPHMDYRKRKDPDYYRLLKAAIDTYDDRGSITIKQMWIIFSAAKNDDPKFADQLRKAGYDVR